MSDILRRLSLSALAVLTIAISSCSADSAQIPVAPERTELLGSLIGTVVETSEELVETTVGTGGELINTTLKLVNGLVYCPSTKSYTGSARIGRRGGVLQVGPHTLVVPPNSLKRDVTITARGPAGDHILVKFEPAGLDFSHSAALTLSYEHCGVISSLLPKRIVYLEKESTNILEVLRSLDDVRRKRVTGRLDHFSTYAVAD